MDRIADYESGVAFCFPSLLCNGTKYRETFVYLCIIFVYFKILWSYANAKEKIGTSLRESLESLESFSSGDSFEF